MKIFKIRFPILRERNNLSDIVKKCCSRNYSSHIPNAKINNPLPYIVKEIQIPAPVGYIAGKLWEPVLNELSGPPGTNINDQPPILCLHGWLDNAGSFDGLIPLIMKKTTNKTFFTMDLPGHGLSTYCPISQYDGLMEGLISITRITQFFGWEKFSLFGHSMGAIISFLYSGLFPEQVHKYVALENIRPLTRDTLEMMRSSVSLVFEVEQKMKVAKRFFPYDELLKRFYNSRMETISFEGCKTLLKRGTVMNEEGNYQYSHNLRTLIPPGKSFSDEESLEIAKEIKCPVCFIKADPGNVYETSETWDAFIKALRSSSERVEVHSIPGTHHFHINDPELVAPVVSKFIES